MSKEYLCPKCSMPLTKTNDYPLQETKEYHCFSCDLTLEIQKLKET